MNDIQKEQALSQDACFAKVFSRDDIKSAAARALFETKAVKIDVERPFTFASGIKSPIYCDNRRILGFPEQRSLIVSCFVQLIAGSQSDVIAGVATAGLPWASFIASDTGMPLAYVRSAAKDHGTKSMIEGADIKGKRVILIEDLISTGKSSIQAVRSLREEGAASVELKAIFSYQFDQASRNFAKENCTFESLSDFSVLIGLLQKENYLSPEEAETALKWSKDPEHWGNGID